MENNNQEIQPAVPINFDNMDTEALWGQILEVKNHCLKYNNFNKTIKKYPEFYRKYPSLMKAVYNNFNLEHVKTMLDKIQKIKNNETNYESENQEIGMLAFNTYLKPQIEKQKLLKDKLKN